MLKMKLQYSGHLMRRTDSLKKTLMLGKIEGRRRRGWQRMRWMASPTRWTWVWASSRRWWWTGRPGELQCTGSQRVVHDWATELNWTEAVKAAVVSRKRDQERPREGSETGGEERAGWGQGVELGWEPCGGGWEGKATRARKREGKPTWRAQSSSESWGENCGAWCRDPGI